VPPAQGDVANEAVAGGAAGLAYMRVLEGGDIDAAKPVKEGLSAEQVSVAGWGAGGGGGAGSSLAMSRAGEV
jgi:aspartyl-tRNA synthetase